MRTYTSPEKKSTTAGVYLCTLLLAAGCAGTAVGTPSSIPATGMPIVFASGVSTTVALAAPGVAMPIPLNKGDSGQFFVAANNAPPNTTVSITTYRSLPPDAPDSTTKNKIFLWIKHTYSNAVTFQAFPHTHYIINSPIGCSVTQETFDGSSWIATEHPSHLAEDIYYMNVDFSGVASQFNVQPAGTYWWLFGFDPKSGLVC